jgi:chitinase
MVAVSKDNSCLALDVFLTFQGFTLSDPSCKTTGCLFSGGGTPGPCTDTSGFLSSVEIETIVANGATITLDSQAAVKIATYNNDQWVSYDDADTLPLKYEFALCHRTN